MKSQNCHQFSRRATRGLFSMLQVAFCLIYLGSSLNDLHVPRTGTYNLLQSLCALGATPLTSMAEGGGAMAHPARQGVRPLSELKQEQAAWLDLHPWLVRISRINFDGVSGEILTNPYWRLEKAIAPHRSRHDPIVKEGA
ncbi:MAG: hypothetical protein WBV28_12430 [Terracidiphilus sp.]